MAQYNFGLGTLSLVPSGANPTPVPFAVLNDMSIDFSYDMKELRGSKQFAIDIAKGAAKVTGKAKNAAINSGALLSVLNGGTSVTGQKLYATETDAIPATPYQVTVAHSANYDTDLGVVDLTTGKVMTRVASSPATGQYSVALGVWTFAAADTTHNVSIGYVYSDSTAGKTTKLANQFMGQSTPFVLHAYNTYESKGVGWKFLQVHVPKLQMAFKAEAYTEQDIDFMCAEDPTSGNIFEFYSFE